jgi:hypothetical protein
MDLAYEPTPRDRDAERARLDARLDSILAVAGQGRILEREPADPAAACEAALLRASHGDWRAASWWLQHHPSARDVWGDHAIKQDISEKVMAKVIAAIAATGLPENLERRLLLQLQAHACNVLPEAQG